MDVVLDDFVVSQCAYRGVVVEEDSHLLLLVGVVEEDHLLVQHVVGHLLSSSLKRFLQHLHLLLEAQV